MKHSNLLLMASFITAVVLSAQTASAQGMMNGPMCSSMGWGGMALSALLIISLIAVFVALTIFLIQKSRRSI